MRTLSASDIDSEEDVEQPDIKVETVSTRPRRSRLNLPAGLMYQEIPGDGHCLYHAVALYLGCNQKYLRQEVATRLEQGDDRKELWIFLQGQLRNNQTIEAYIAGIREGKEWADHVEIEVLMRVLKRPIVIISPNGGLRNPQVVARHFAHPTPIFVRYNGHDHYDAVILEEDADAWQIISDLNQHMSSLTSSTDTKQELLNSQPASHNRVIIRCWKKHLGTGKVAHISLNIPCFNFYRAIGIGSNGKVKVIESYEEDVLVMGNRQATEQLALDGLDVNKMHAFYEDELDKRVSSINYQTFSSSKPDTDNDPHQETVDNSLQCALFVRIMLVQGGINQHLRLGNMDMFLSAIAYIVYPFTVVILTGIYADDNYYVHPPDEKNYLIFVMSYITPNSFFMLVVMTLLSFIGSHIFFFREFFSKIYRFCRCQTGPFTTPDGVWALCEELKRENKLLRPSDTNLVFLRGKAQFLIAYLILTVHNGLSFPIGAFVLSCFGCWNEGISIAKVAKVSFTGSSIDSFFTAFVGLFSNTLANSPELQMILWANRKEGMEVSEDEPDYVIRNRPVDLIMDILIDCRRICQGKAPKTGFFHCYLPLLRVQIFTNTLGNIILHRTDKNAVPLDDAGGAFLIGASIILMGLCCLPCLLFLLMCIVLFIRSCYDSCVGYVVDDDGNIFDPEGNRVRYRSDDCLKIRAPVRIQEANEDYIAESKSGSDEEKAQARCDAYRSIFKFIRDKELDDAKPLETSRLLPNK